MTKRKLLAFLSEAKQAGKSIVGYGAPGKGNTLLNYCGIRTDLVDYTVDRNPYKMGEFFRHTHPYFSAGEDPRNQAGLRPDPGPGTCATRFGNSCPTSASGAENS